MRALPAISMILLLSACGDQVARPIAAIPRSETHLPRHTAGRDDVVGADAESLIRQFGTPRLDIRDGDARKLQWSGTACILDAYLYPDDRGTRPTATFIDARRGDGRDVDRASCVAALRKN